MKPKYIFGNPDSEVLLVLPAMNSAGSDRILALNDDFGRRLIAQFQFFGVDPFKIFAITYGSLGADVEGSDSETDRKAFRAQLRTNIDAVDPKLIVGFGPGGVVAAAEALGCDVENPTMRRVYRFAGRTVIGMSHTRHLVIHLRTKNQYDFYSQSEEHRLDVAYVLFRILQLRRGLFQPKTLAKLHNFLAGSLPTGEMYTVVSTVDAARKLEAEVRAHGYFVYDFETTSLLENTEGVKSGDGHVYSRYRRIVCLGIAVGGKSYVIPFEHNDKAAPHAERGVHDIVRGFMEDTDIQSCAHNASFEYECCNRWLGWKVPLASVDTMLANHARECKQGSNKLNNAARLVGLKGFKEEAFGGAIDKANLIDAPHKNVYLYNAFDCLVTEQLMMYFLTYQDFGSEGRRFSRALKVMHKNFVAVNEMAYGGVRVDVDKFHHLKAKNTAAKETAWLALLNHPDVSRFIEEKELDMAKKKWKSCADCQTFSEMMMVVAERGLKNRPQFNFASADQMAWLMYTKLKYPQYMKTEAGKASTNDDAIGRLAQEGYEVAKLLSDFRKFQTMESMFYEPTEEKIVFVDGVPRLFSSWLQHGTESGRLSCKNPNLQQYPTELKPIVLPDDDESVIIDADESQLELRLLAIYSEERLHHILNDIEPVVAAQKNRPPRRHGRIQQKSAVMSGAYRRKLDLHKITAYKFYVDKMASILDLDKEKLSVIDKRQRKQGKRTNFGISYGMGAAKYVRQSEAEGIECTMEEAKEMIESVGDTFPCIGRFKDAVWTYCRYVLLGKTFTHFGTRRPMYNLFSEDFGKQKAAEREAFNNPIQGDGGLMTQLCAYHFIRLCLKNAESDPAWLRVRLMAIIHDSVVVSAPIQLAQKAARLLYLCLAKPAQFVEMEEFGDFPFDSSVEVGFRWGCTIPVCGEDKPEEVTEWSVSEALALADTKFEGGTRWPRKQRSSEGPPRQPSRNGQKSRRKFRAKFQLA